MKITIPKSKNKSISLIFLVFTLFLSFVNSNHQQQSIEIIPSSTQAQQETTWENLSLQQTYINLNQQIQSLDKDFSKDFVNIYHVQNSRLLQAFHDETMAGQLKLENIKQEPGNYLLFLGKMYLYDMLPKSHLTGYTWTMYASDSRYLLAYFYLKIAAERYENAEAYYYLGVLDYYKLTPHQTFIKNLENEVNRISVEEGYDKVYQLHYNELLDYLRNQRFVSVEQNLFFSSMLGHHGASLSLAYMYKQGIGLDKNYKNCTTALSYFLSVVKDTYVDFYQFRSSYADETNFQKELYVRKKVVFENQQNVDVVSSSEFFDSETIKAMYELAESYFIGRNGFKKNYVKAAELYAKLAAQDHKNSMAMLGMCYFKGQGVPLDRKRAKVLFDHSSKVSISQAMLIVMDYFQLQSLGNRPHAIKKMTGKPLFNSDIYQKKKQNMNPILKYLFATLVIKGDIKSVKTDDAVLLLGSAAKEGHLMAKITMGLLFSDGIDVNFDCQRAINYFSEEALSHPFFMVHFKQIQEKFYMARLGLKSQHQTFSLIKYLELTIMGDTNSFINALYVLEIENEGGLSMNEDSWNLKTVNKNPLYQLLKQQKIVPDIYSFFQKEYSFLGKKPIKFSTLQRLFQGSPQVLKQHQQYIKKKIIKVCAVTKENSLMNFYEYKMSQYPNLSLLSTISNGEADKLHVLQSRYLLGQYYHNKSFQLLQKGKDYTKEQYKALQQYKRASNSPLLGKILFYIEEINLNPENVNFEDQLFQFGFINDLLTYTFVLSIVLFILYYKRSKKLDEIHQKELQKRQEEIRIKKEENQVKQKNGQTQSHNFSSQNLYPSHQQKEKQLQRQISSNYQNQPDIVEQRPMKGYRIGSSQEEDPLVLREVQHYEEYKFEQSPSNNDESETNIQSRDNKDKYQ